jgi:hypothetical protein
LVTKWFKTCAEIKWSEFRQENKDKKSANYYGSNCRCEARNPQFKAILNWHPFICLGAILHLTKNLVIDLTHANVITYLAETILKHDAATPSQLFQLNIHFEA